jgi:ABC-type uncharacterized transport system ATPase subunit
LTKERFLRRPPGRDHRPLRRFQNRHHLLADRGQFPRRWISAVSAKWSSNSANRIQLKVKRDHVIAVCKELLDKVPVNDIDIQEVPIEDVIRQIFALP